MTRSTQLQALKRTTKVVIGVLFLATFFGLVNHHPRVPRKVSPWPIGKIQGQDIFPWHGPVAKMAIIDTGVAHNPFLVTNRITHLSVTTTRSAMIHGTMVVGILAAPGNLIKTTTLHLGKHGQYIGWLSGTSAAAPFVTAACAVLLGIDPSLTPHELRDILYRTAQTHPSSHGLIRIVDDEPRPLCVVSNHQRKTPGPWDVPTGNIGAAAVFAFHAAKNAAIGESGMVMANDLEAARQVRLYINHGSNELSRHVQFGLSIAQVYKTTMYGSN